MTRRYSALSLVKEGLTGQKGWEPAWRSPEPKKTYDAVIIGGGGHGLATAYYLAKTHGITNIAVLERAGSAAAIPAATPRWCVPTITIPKAWRSTAWRTGSMRGCRRT